MPDSARLGKQRIDQLLQFLYGCEVWITNCTGFSTGLWPRRAD